MSFPHTESSEQIQGLFPAEILYGDFNSRVKSMETSFCLEGMKLIKKHLENLKCKCDL